MTRSSFVLTCLAASVVITSVLSGCKSQPVAASTPLAGGREYVLIVDLSASRSSAMEQEEKNFLHSLAQQLKYGDQVVMLQTQQDGLKDRPKRWILSMPATQDPLLEIKRDASHFKSAQEGLENAVDYSFRMPSDATIQHTDILTTLHLAAESIQDGLPGRPATVILLSDMLQSANGIRDGAVQEDACPWVDRAAKDRWPDTFLGGACVIVIGADSTNAAGVKVKRFWEDYFAATGASLNERDYRATPPRPSRNLCR